MTEAGDSGRPPTHRTVIIMLSELEGRVLEAVAAGRDEARGRFEHLGDALGEIRSDVRSLGDRFDAHVREDDLRFRDVDSDHRQLRERVDGVDDTSRQLQLDAARADVVIKRADVEVTKDHDGRRAVIRTVALSLLSFLLGIGGSLLIWALTT